MNDSEKDEATLQKIIKSKEEFHARQRELSVKDKLKILVKLQRLHLSFKPESERREIEKPWDFIGDE